MKHIYIGIFLFLSVTAHGGNKSACKTSCQDLDNCQRQIQFEKKNFEFYSNFPIDQQNDCINKVIFVVHGTERDARSRYKAALDAAKSVGVQDRLLIISPYFKTDDDSPNNNDLYWSTSGWKQGNTSNNSGSKISSFAIADLILEKVIGGSKFTNLKAAAITGHSAGGQYTQMYALSSTFMQSHSDIAFQFLVLNPSNYTYLNRLRLNPNTSVFEEPVQKIGRTWHMKPDFDFAGNCPNDFNEYKYGLEDRNNYSEDISDSDLISQYKNRAVFYFLGTLDNDPDHDLLDKSCEAELQGPHRLARGQNYFQFMKTKFSPNIHELKLVEGIGHSASGMYSSTAVKSVLFNL